jgi:hypothetical protein
MNVTPRELDCESFQQMMKETPETAALIIDMIAEFDVADEHCIKRMRELQKAIR